MANPYVGEIKLVPFNFAPRGWAACNGQLLSINQYAALFALLGTTYGGNGTSNFGLPNLQGRVMLHRSTDGQYPQGSMSGVEQEQLSLSEMPMHNHVFNGTSDTANAAPPQGHTLGKSSAGGSYYAAPGAIQSLATSSISPIGGNQPHNNMQPYLVMNYVIALVGVFPSRN